MSIKVVSGIAGSVTTIGGGIGIYLFNNRKNDTNNPPKQNQQPISKQVKKLDNKLLKVQNIKQL